MPMEILWNQIGQTRWSALTKDAALQQSWGYGAACHALGSPILRAQVLEAGQPIALAQFVRRSFAGLLHVAVCTRGPVWLQDVPRAIRRQVMIDLRRTMPLPRLRGVFFTPEETTVHPWLTGAGYVMVMTPYSTAELDLTQSASDLRAGFHGKWRNRLVAAEKAGFLVARSDKTPDRYRWLLDHETRQQGQRRYAALPVELVPEWQGAMGRDGLRVLTASKNGEVAAAMAFLLHGKRATYHIGWSAPVGKKHSAHNLILWTALGKLRQLGIETLDLGGLNTQDVPGIARFKLGTGARVKTLCGTWFGR